MQYVLDNSVAMRWLLASQKQTDQAYAETVLRSFTEAEAVVPHLWQLEAANVLLAAEKRGEIELAAVECFITQLESLPIQIDPLTAHQAFRRLTDRLIPDDAVFLFIFKAWNPRIASYVRVSTTQKRGQKDKLRWYEAIWKSP